MQDAVTWLLSIAALIFTVGTGVGIIVWQVGRLVSGLEEKITSSITASARDIRLEFSTRVGDVDETLGHLKNDFIEHRAEDQGWFRNLGERIARLEGRKGVN